MAGEWQCPLAQSHHHNNSNAKYTHLLNRHWLVQHNWEYPNDNATNNIFGRIWLAECFFAGVG